MVLNIIIIGNSGAASECYTIIHDMLTVGPFKVNFRFKGFLSHKGYKGNLGFLEQYELGSDEDYIPAKHDVFALGIGDNALRLEAFHAMKEKGGEFISLVSPWAYIAENVQIGEGNIIGTTCHISSNVVMGDANYLNGNVRIGHDVTIGDGNFLGQQSMVFGAAKIGNINQLGPLALIMEKSKVGNNNVIAPSSVIYKGCRDNCIMAGNPAIKMTQKES